LAVSQASHAALFGGVAEDDEEADGRKWIPHHISFPYTEELYGLKTRVMLGVQITLPDNTVSSANDIAVSVEEDGTSLVVMLGYHKAFKNPRMVHGQRMRNLRKDDSRSDEEADRLYDNLVNRRAAAVKAVNSMQAQYQSSSLKGVFRLELPFKVEEEISYLKMHDVDGKIIDIDLVKVTSNTETYTEKKAIGFAYSNSNSPGSR
jgi:hypothetical protein